MLFRSPIPFYEDFNLKDDSNSKRIYTRLIELGILTAEEGLTAIETGRLPDKESSLQSQKDFAALKDEGLYSPLIGGPKVEEGQAGRPVGTDNIKQQTKKISRIGASKNFDNDLHENTLNELGSMMQDGMPETSGLDASRLVRRNDPQVEENKNSKSNLRGVCWKGYTAKGLKKKGSRKIGRAHV